MGLQGYLTDNFFVTVTSWDEQDYSRALAIALRIADQNGRELTGDAAVLRTNSITWTTAPKPPSG